MSLDYVVDIVQGFLVKYNDLFREKTVERQRCEHNFDRTTIKFCPECGQSSEPIVYTEAVPVMDLDLESLRDNDMELGNGLSLVEVRSNCDLEGEEKNLVLGKRFGMYPTQPDEAITFVKPVGKEDVLANIKKLGLNITFNKDSFGIYIVTSIY